MRTLFQEAPAPRGCLGPPRSGGLLIVQVAGRNRDLSAAARRDAPVPLASGLRDMLSKVSGFGCGKFSGFAEEFRNTGGAGVTWRILKQKRNLGNSLSSVGRAG